MRLMIINPDWGMTKEQMEERCRFLSGFVSGDTELSMRCLEETPVQLDSVADAVMAGPEILKIAMEAERDGYDAVILYCFSDPAMEACRQAVSIPVVGCGQAACLMIPLVAYQGAVIVADERRIPEKRMSIGRTGLSADRIAGFEAITTSGQEETRKVLMDALVDAGRRALANTGAQALVLGCLTFLGTAPELEKFLGVPVIDPGPAAVILAEGMVRQGLRSSVRAFLDRDAMTEENK